MSNLDKFSLFLGDENLEFSELTFNKHLVEVNQILREGGFNPTLEHRLVELTYPGTKSFDNDEEIELDPQKPRKFLVGKSDRLYSFAIDDISYDSPFENLRVSCLCEMACIGKGKSLVLTREGQDQLLKIDDSVSFADKKLERIFSRDSKKVKVTHNNEESLHLEPGEYDFEQIIELFKISPDMLVDYIVVGQDKLIKFKSGEKISLCSEIKIFSNEPSGGSS